MTQIIFHVAAIACIVYTVCSFGLFIHKRMRKNKNTENTSTFLLLKLPAKRNRILGKTPLIHLP